MLNNHTYYSLGYGAMSTEELVEELSQRALGAAVITDINSTAGVIEFARLAEKSGMKPVVGVDFRKDIDQQFVALAKNQDGFSEINEQLSAFLSGRIEMPQRIPVSDNYFTIVPFEKAVHMFSSVDELLHHEFIGVSMTDLNRFRFSKFKNRHQKIVWAQPFTFRNKRDFNIHRLLRAIHKNTLLSKLEPSEQASNEDHLAQDFRQKLGELELHWLVDNAENILTQCSIDFDFHGTLHKNQLHFGKSAEADYELLENLARNGVMERFKNPGPAVWERLEKELRIIREMNFVSYFLINWDIVNYARSKGYFYVGRGSGANSIVAYLLRITDVDPLELDLYFERFINLFRKSPPDFDIDFSWKDREDVTQYIFSRHQNVALLGAVNTYQYAAVIRELGKVFGLPKHEIDALVDGKIPLGQSDDLHRLVVKYGGWLKNFPHYISIHSAGIVITERPVSYYGATFLPPKGFPTTQFDMYQAEDIRINKLDILSQRGLAKIKDAVNMIREKEGDLSFDIHDIERFKNDDRCNALLRNAQAVGCFYVESPAMRMLLRKLQTHNYLGLVAASSVIRPGVSSSGMMRQFILRERIPERRQDAPPSLMKLMPETHGVMVYQEDVIKVAHEFAGLSLAEADVLRRGMSGKFRGREEFDNARQKFLEGGVANGHTKSMVEDVWRQVESFAGYAFAKGHSASYAVESYQCLFLKAYYPLEFMTATINNDGGFYRTEIYVHEARKCGANILSPCVQESDRHAVLKGRDLYLGFSSIKSLDTHIAERIVRQRLQSRFNDVDDFLERVHPGLEQMILLIRAGALQSFGIGKKELLWHAHTRLTKAPQDEMQTSMFRTEVKTYQLPALEHHRLEDAYDELELLGFPLGSPFEWMDPDAVQSIVDLGIPIATAEQLPNIIGCEVIVLGYRVTLKPTTTTGGKSMYFGTFLDMNGDFLDTVHFPGAAEKFSIQGWGIFWLRGKVSEEFDVITVEVSSAGRVKLLPDPRHSATVVSARDNQSGNDRWISKYLKRNIS